MHDGRIAHQLVEGRRRRGDSLKAFVGGARSVEIGGRVRELLAAEAQHELGLAFRVGFYGTQHVYRGAPGAVFLRPARHRARGDKRKRLFVAYRFGEFGKPVELEGAPLPTKGRPRRIDERDGACQSQVMVGNGRLVHLHDIVERHGKVGFAYVAEVLLEGMRVQVALGALPLRAQRSGQRRAVEVFGPFELVAAMRARPRGAVEHGVGIMECRGVLAPAHHVVIA